MHVLSDLDERSGQWPECLMVVDWPEDKPEPYHVYVAWLKSEPSAARLRGWSRGRFPVEQFYQRGKTDLGLDHFEGRSWQGFHHHLVMAMVAYLFVTSVYLRVRVKKTSGVTWEQVLRLMRPWLLRHAERCPHCGSILDSLFHGIAPDTT